MIDPELQGRVVLVTGANHGIGAATAKAFALQGAAVLLTYLRLPLDPANDEGAEGNDLSRPGRALYRAKQAAPAEPVVQAIRERGGQAEAIEADLTDTGTIPRLFDQAEAAFGPVEILVNNAAHCTGDTFLPQSRIRSEDRNSGGARMVTLTPESHDLHFAVNSRASALLMAEFARRSIERGAVWGRIINVSTDGASAFSGEVSYGASKHALESYSRAAADELGPYGITVNIVSLGPVQTGYITAEMEARGRSDIPLRRIGEPEDVAGVIVFLASEQARWLTGQLLYVGGGHVMPL